MSTDGNHFQDEFAKQAAKALFEFVWSGIKSAGHTAWKEVEVKRALNEYVNTYQQRYGKVSVLGMSRPMDLHKIYTGAKVVSSDYLTAFADEKQLEEYYKRDRTHSHFTNKNSKSGMSIANDEQFLNILGSAGAGKSTFLRRIGQQALCGSSSEYADSDGYKHKKIPVLLELRRIKDQKPDLVQYMQEEFVACGFPDSKKFVENGLKAGRFLLLFDGLDEVPSSNLDSVIDAITDFVTKYGRLPDGNRFVTSCRTAHYKQFFKRFTNVVLTSFTDEQISFFADNWFSTEDDKAQGVSNKFYKMLTTAGNEPARELARTPLLLTFLCMTFEHSQELPATMATLYRRSLDILLREWAAERRVHNDPIPGNISSELEVDMLSKFAFNLFVSDQFFFKRSQAIEQFKIFLGEIVGIPKTVDTDAILSAIEIQQCLIVRRAQDSYSFSHLTIQEYLVAKYIWDKGASSWPHELKDSITSLRWHVVLNIMAGMGPADQFSMCLSDLNKDLILSYYNKSNSVKLLMDFLEWADSRFIGEKEHQHVSRTALFAIIMLFLGKEILAAVANSQSSGPTREYVKELFWSSHASRL